VIYEKRWGSREMGGGGNIHLLNSVLYLEEEEETKSMPYAPVYKMEKLERICSDWARKSL
jgi:hypothetical protein